MQIQFTQLPYQEDAVNAAVDILKGQDSLSSIETSEDLCQDDELLTDLTISNRLLLSDDEILKNVHAIENRNHLAKSTDLYGKNKDFLQFNVEMETGTGKTFVYLKTMLEMNQRYGFKKFVVVVPSIAIKEGTNSALRETKEYFGAHYSGLVYDSFVYDSKNLNQVWNFASSNNIEIMVMNIAAFNKQLGPEASDSNQSNVNIMYRENDTLNGRKPIDLIAATRPILIIDEPQSVDNTPKAKRALNALEPLFGLRYSGTHKEKSYPLIYKFDAVDAFNAKMVKQIKVVESQLDDQGNSAYLKLIKVENRSQGLRAQIELDVSERNGQIKRKKVWLKQNDDLFEKSGFLPAYESVSFIQDIEITDPKAGSGIVTFDGAPDSISTENQTTENDDTLKRAQIAKAIEIHLRKEQELNPKGIKVLTLFFLDKVANYRQYDESGNQVPGKYYRMFEEEYLKAQRGSGANSLRVCLLPSC
ncbi:DEAD/DEAH box helicase family protein [Oenococcus kitaharae]|uniref:Type III restriction-modification system restriction subunit n=1 Tax=Oenococcus kitaharae DSM 17330 TaxID=1045004 RepID=G9WHQ5_9LACO|nr:DEAD/DEAH box helicase family protein [Oenococcus kitaharae]EHN58629.1 type III restriction-modification system restriction subunit [Oenococcus kitaharae DSM 17330]